MADVVYSAAHPFLTLPEHPAAFHPSSGHVHRAQSVQVEPLGRIPQVGHQVHPKNPGRLSSRSVKVLIGIAAFKRLPGLVVPKGRRSPRRRWGLRSRSMVAALISSTCLLTSASRTSSPCRSKAPANSPKKGCSLLPHIRSPASQTALKPLTAYGPYFLGRGGGPVLARRRTWASPQGADQGLAVTPGDLRRFVQESSLFLPVAFKTTLSYRFQTLLHTASRCSTLRQQCLRGNDAFFGNIYYESFRQVDRGALLKLPCFQNRIIEPETAGPPERG